MTVVWIMFMIVIVICVYILVLKIDAYSYRVYGFEFFTLPRFMIVFVANIFLYFGESWYVEEAVKSGDILNGIILILIGLGLILYNTYINISKTSLVFGFLVSLFQLALFAIGSLFALLGLFIMLALLSQTKPVYNLN